MHQGDGGCGRGKGKGRGEPPTSLAITNAPIKTKFCFHVFPWQDSLLKSFRMKMEYFQMAHLKSVSVYGIAFFNCFCHFFSVYRHRDLEMLLYFISPRIKVRQTGISVFFLLSDASPSASAL